MFFTHINQLMTQGVDLTIVIRKKENDLMVSTLPKSNGLKDEAQHYIVPLTLTGSPAELDAGFLQAIARPMQKAAGLIANLEQFEQQAAKASANSKAAKDAQAKESKEAKEKREKYEKFTKKADELIAEKKYSEAMTNLQQARLHSTEQTKKTGDDKITEVKAAMNQGSLFAMEEIPPVQPPQQAQPVSQPQPMPQQAQVTTVQQPISQPVQPQPMQQPVVPQMQQPMPTQQPMNGYLPPQQFSPATAPIPATPATMFEDEYRYPTQASAQSFDPAYCRPDEYAAYPDFPASMQAPSYNHVQTPQIF